MLLVCVRRGPLTYVLVGLGFASREHGSEARRPIVDAADDGRCPQSRGAQVTMPLTGLRCLCRTFTVIQPCPKAVDRLKPSRGTTQAFRLITRRRLFTVGGHWRRLRPALHRNFSRTMAHQAGHGEPEHAGAADAATHASLPAPSSRRNVHLDSPSLLSHIQCPTLRLLTPRLHHSHDMLRDDFAPPAE